MNPATLAERLSARRNGAGWTARCPAHEDRVASLSIGTGRDGRVLLHCHANCDTEAIARAAGLEMADLFPDDDRPSKPTIASKYDYRDADGRLVYQVVRFSPKGFRQRQPNGSGGWLWNLKGVDRLPYRLPELLAADPRWPVFIVEGEKDADRLADRGLVATCNAGGAGKWSGSFAAHLRGRPVVILPDNDDPGRKHAQAVARSLQGAAKSVRIVELPGLPEKGDVSDWLADGGDADTLVSIARETEEFDAAEPSHEPAADRAELEQGGGFESVPVRLAGASKRRKHLAGRVIPFNVSYLDDCCIGIHPTDLVVISAATGAGKTTLGSLLAQRAAEDGRRAHFFALEAFRDEIENRMLFRELSVLAAEHRMWNRGMTLNRWLYGRCPELDALEEEATARLSDRLKTMRTFYRGARFTSEDITRLFHSAKGEADLIVLDHVHYVDGEGPNENAELKRIAKAIRDVALAMEVPVIVIAHLRKKQGGKVVRIAPDLDDVHGSSDLVKIATKVVLVAPCRGELASKDPGVATTLVQVAKDRYQGVNGFCALMQFDMSSMSYRETYGVARVSPGGDRLLHLGQGDLPSWAKHGMGLKGQYGEETRA